MLYVSIFDILLFHPHSIFSLLLFMDCAEYFPLLTFCYFESASAVLEPFHCWQVWCSSFFDTLKIVFSASLPLLLLIYPLSS